MMTNLTWTALLLAALAALAWWNPEGEPGCRETRPLFGAGACCVRHRAASVYAFATVAALEAARRAEAGPAELP